MKKVIKSEREVLGMATFERFEANTVDRAWEKYGKVNEDFEKESYVAEMKAMFNTDFKESNIGCILNSTQK